MSFIQNNWTVNGKIMDNRKLKYHIAYRVDCEPDCEVLKNDNSLLEFDSYDEAYEFIQNPDLTKVPNYMERVWKYEPKSLYVGVRHYDNN